MCGSHTHGVASGELGLRWQLSGKQHVQRNDGTKEKDLSFLGSKQLRQIYGKLTGDKLYLKAETSLCQHRSV